MVDRTTVQLVPRLKQRSTQRRLVHIDVVSVAELADIGAGIIDSVKEVNDDESPSPVSTCGVVVDSRLAESVGDDAVDDATT